VIGLLSDLRAFLLHRPELETLVEIRTQEERLDSNRRIVQRLPINVEDYSVLNVHKVGIRTPAVFAYEQLLRWTGDSTYWPNHIATVESVERGRERVRVLFVGGATRALRRWMKGIAPEFGTLFRLTAIKLQHVPPPSEFDNARYLLYECSGGYPIGVMCLYVRSPIHDLNEIEEAQLFFAVSFNFYGRKRWPGINLVRAVWELIHNRVTANVLVRFKRLCESEFRQLTEVSSRE
jgi:hypothetical protein